MILSKPQEYIMTSCKPRTLFLAGVGSGKTHLIAVSSYNYIKNFPMTSGFIGANTHNQLSTSTMAAVLRVWKRVFGLQMDVHFVVGKQPPSNFTVFERFIDYNGIISFQNGCTVFIGSLENAKVHDGKQFGWAFLDETKDTREVDVKETIATRLRQQGMWVCNDRLVGEDSPGAVPFLPLSISTSPAKVQWLNEWFGLDKFKGDISKQIFSKDQFFGQSWGDKAVAISSTFHNSKNLPDGYIEQILRDNTEERGQALVYGNPFTKTGGEFYSAFSALRHKGRVDFVLGLPVHISFDQNVVPYITATLWQVQPGDRVQLRQFDEFCLPNPNNTTDRLCDAIIAKYGDRIIGGLFYYGDASGHKRDTRGADTDYTIVQRRLRRYLSNYSDRTQRSNPGILKRRDFINNLLDGRMKYDVLIDERCVDTITDYMYLKQDANGLKSKEKAKDPVSGSVFEKYGHTSDANDYFLTTVLVSDFDKFSNQNT